MKKYLFFATAVFAGLSLKAQTVYVADNTGVKVGSSTLFYVNGGVTLANSTTDNQKFSNEGNVKIEGGGLITNSTTGKSFSNEYTGAGQYGQLIVDGSTQLNTGKISSQVKFKDGFGIYPLAIPYFKITVKDIVDEIFGKPISTYSPYTGNKNFQSTRANNPLFYWDNNIYSFVELGKEEVFKEDDAARYYGVNTYLDQNTKQLDTNKKTLTGTPVNKNITVTVNSYVPEGNKYTNKYGEAYGSYIIDFTTAMPSNWDHYYENGAATTVKNTKKDNEGEVFGENIYDFGNPYTSNLDLTVDGSGFPWSDVRALVQYESQDYTKEINESHASGSYGGSDFAAMTGDKTGDKYLGLVRPFQTFAVKMKNKKSSFTFTFNDKMKVFKSSSSLSNSPAPNTMFSRNAGDPIINQLRIKLYDSKDRYTGVRCYVVASNIYEAAQKGKGTEVYNIAMSDKDTGIYTLQENEDGSVNQDLSNDRTYINGINDKKYQGKPIHLAIQNGKGNYSFKVELNKDLLNSGKYFYFEDKKTGEVKRVTENFVYTFNVEGTDKDRFILYWAKQPSKKLEENLSKDESSNTFVYKDLAQYKVRFSSKLKHADIFVYNISGQLVNVVKNIDTTNDYVIPIKGNASVYIVKIVGDNKEVVTKKIIK